MKNPMKNKLLYIFSLLIVLVSCNQENNQKRLAENAKDAKKKKIIFENIQKGWDFYDEPINEATEESIKTWTELRVFMQELAQKPRKTIGAFQQKSDAISKKAMVLNMNIPVLFDKPQIKSRISVLITKVRLLDMYIHLDNIPDKKVVQLVGEINKELATLQRQMDILTEKSKIPVEEGEDEMRRMLLDSARAIPNNTVMPTVIPVGTRGIINPNDARVE
ncbi:hypothetical protein SAMN05192550_0707 [Flavobacterium glycines]|uniref:Lipoprotein n=2 Tax=Flavobacterium glycines TaxID=551990 RepID=A0A511CG74_9FLAO|nr:hypothetical protein FGL01_10030 [Flavobacterium glycines]SDI74607.1 hypothetical protein SAMN05192550_0707 [Flavobacterium glycines]